MNYKKIVLAISVILISFSVGRFSKPKEIEIQQVEKIVYKESEQTKEDKKTKSTRRETILPDGTRQIEIVRETDKSIETDKNAELNSEKSLVSKTTIQSQYSIGLYQVDDNISATFDRRIIGGLFLGLKIDTNKDLSSPKYGAGLRFEF